jgi:hypothetical protein
VLDPIRVSPSVMDPQCWLCDLFLPLFSEHERHLGIWHVATYLFAFKSQLFAVEFPSCRHVRMFHEDVRVPVVRYSDLSYMLMVR